METESRIIDKQKKPEDKTGEVKLRPKEFSDFPGQHEVKSKLQVFVKAAKLRKEPLDHVLLCGPPGLGKTTLSYIIANSLASPMVATSGPALHKKGDLAALLTSLKPNSVLFIDEIHRISKDIEEYLYSAMEDFHLDIMTGEGLGARTMRFKIAPFTLIGATTRAGLLKAPFRDRFGILERLNFYDKESLVKIVNRSAVILGMNLDKNGAEELAKRSRGTPRIINRLLKRVRDYAMVENKTTIDKDLARYALEKLNVDEFGLDSMDQKILKLIHFNFSGGPVGIETLAAALSEESDTIEEVYEPYLIQEGFIQKTPRGRMITDLGKSRLPGEK